jgi:translation initiation factor 4A
MLCCSLLLRRHDPVAHCQSVNLSLNCSRSAMNSASCTSGSAQSTLEKQLMVGRDVIAASVNNVAMMAVTLQRCDAPGRLPWQGLIIAPTPQTVSSACLVIPPDASDSGGLRPYAAFGCGDGPLLEHDSLVLGAIVAVGTAERIETLLSTGALSAAAVKLVSIVNASEFAASQSSDATQWLHNILRFCCTDVQVVVFDGDAMTSATLTFAHTLTRDACVLTDCHLAATTSPSQLDDVSVPENLHEAVLTSATGSASDTDAQSCTRSRIRDNASTTVPPLDFESALSLETNLLRGVYSYGFEIPTPVQLRALAPFAAGGDLIVHAPAGSGKTAALVIGALQRCDFTAPQSTQALILTPTREAALLTQRTVLAIGDFLSSRAQFCACFVGGDSVREDIRRLQAGIIIAVGTPGRVADVMKRGALHTSSLKVLALDAADVLLTRPLGEQLYDIFKYLPKDVQVALFSATMPDDVLELTKKFMRNPTRILVKRESLTLEGIKHFYVAVEEDHKLETLMDLYESVSIAQSVIFANTRRKVDYIKDQLDKHRLVATYLHAEMQRGEREKVMNAFRAGSSRVLVTTDLVARSVEALHLQFVVHYDMPTDPTLFAARNGRLRPERHKGVVICFTTANDVQMLRETETLLGISIEELPLDFLRFLA